jgi:F-type H+-transporting ATPase subunit epsilon
MTITVLTPDKEIFKGAITSVKVPGTGGQFQVLKNHAPIVSSLAKGEVTVVKESGEKMKFSIQKGFIEVLNNEVSLLVQGVVTA